MSVSTRAALVLGLPLALASLPLPAARAAESCQPTGPVSLLILATGQKVHEYAASLKGARVVARDATTVILGDGRVITADLDSATQHLNALGWGNRHVQIVMTMPRRAARPRRASG